MTKNKKSHNGDSCRVRCFNEKLVASLRASMPSPPTTIEAAGLFAALSEPNRFLILNSLKSGEELCVCDVANVLGMSIATASHHLRRLRDMKILKYRSDGKMAYYSLRNKFVASLISETLAHLESGKSEE